MWLIKGWISPCWRNFIKVIGFVKLIDSINQMSFTNIINVIFFTKVVKLVIVMNLITNIQFLKVMNFIEGLSVIKIKSFIKVIAFLKVIYSILMRSSINCFTLTKAANFFIVMNFNQKINLAKVMYGLLRLLKLINFIKV